MSKRLSFCYRSGGIWVARSAAKDISGATGQHSICIRSDGQFVAKSPWSMHVQEFDTYGGAEFFCNSKEEELLEAEDVKFTKGCRVQLRISPSCEWHGSGVVLGDSVECKGVTYWPVLADKQSNPMLHATLSLRVEEHL